MDPRLAVCRAVAAAALVALVPTAILCIGSPPFVVLAVLESATLAVATAYAVFVGIYRAPP